MSITLRKRKYSFNLIREEFALINTKPSLPKFQSLIAKNAYTDDGSEYNMDWCEKYRKLCLQNYDLNMIYFSQLKYDDFDSVIKKFTKQHRFFEIKNLSECDGVSGYYIMILDKYKQAYIGKSKDIKRRILSHWSSTLPFDRTLFPMYAVETSTFSIDFFRALDTARVFILKRHQCDNFEEKLIAEFPNKLYLTNRIGGDIEKLRGPEQLLKGFETINQRNLLEFKADLGYL